MKIAPLVMRVAASTAIAIPAALTQVPTTQQHAIARIQLVPSARARIQIGPPPSRSLLATWRSELFSFEPLQPTGTNIDALQAIEAGQRVFVTGPHAYVIGVRYGKVTNPHQIHPSSSGLVWVVMYRDDTRLPTSCPSSTCPHFRGRGHATQYAQTNTVVDAKSGQALFKFQTGR